MDGKELVEGGWYRKSSNQHNPLDINQILSVSILATCKTVYIEAYEIVRKHILGSSPRLILDHGGCLCAHAFVSTLECFFRCLQDAHTLLWEGPIASEDVSLLNKRKDALAKDGPCAELALHLCRIDRYRSEPPVNNSKRLPESISLLEYHFEPLPGHESITRRELLDIILEHIH
jgi:hypothetical protein